ncbi:MAG TPA: prolyl oligopeptidase family serine peptidase [Chloroflexia bacterium]|nr:prolyl oligopeptidase family serine peptidase [Chloroflexia bacterium]
MSDNHPARQTSHSFSRNHDSTAAGNASLYEKVLSRLPVPAGQNRTLKINYLLYLPKDYNDRSAEKRWPLLFFLHGSGERGDNLEIVKNYGLPKLIEQGQDFPFIVVSPQCPANRRWIDILDVLDGLYADILENYRIDTDRVYLTGLSMGGQGVWYWTIAQPERFAAIAPVCGRSNPGKAEVIRAVPAWVFHGAKDEVVPASESFRMVEALKKAGADVRMTLYPETGHNSWNEAYDTPELYSWLLEHSLKDRLQS